jgi:hypothetical protein
MILYFFPVGFLGALTRGSSNIMLGKNNSGCKDIEKAILMEEPDARQIFDEVCH